MKKIQYSVELLKDFDSLLKDFIHFMSINLVHADQGAVDKCRVGLQQLIKYSNEHARPLTTLFKAPVLNYSKYNGERLAKNFVNIMQFFHKYLAYAEKVLKHCKPELYKARFKKLRKHYLEFYAKYLA